MAVTTNDGDHTGGQATGQRGFFNDAFSKEVAPKGMTLDAIIAGLRGF
jgi:hypothetical protein